MADNCWHSILLVGMTDGRNRRLVLRSMCESHFRAMAMFLSIGSPSGRPPHPTTLGFRCASQQGWLPMSESGQKRRFDPRPVTSGLSRLADVLGVCRHVSNVPKGDIA